MSSVDDRQNSATTGQNTPTGALPMPGFVSQLSPTEQLSFPNTAPFPFSTEGPSQFSPVMSRALSEPALTAGATRPLSDPGRTGNLSIAPFASPGVTHNLAEVAEAETGALVPVRAARTTTSLRQTVIIRGNGNKGKRTIRPPKGRRWVIHITGTLGLLLVAFATLLAVSPAGSFAEWSFNPFRSISGSAMSSNASLSFLQEQAATVTAVTQDGHDTGSHNYPGLPTPPPSFGGNGSGDGFTYGQCTYWADYYYHQLTGHYVPWGGDAWAWANGARASGWVVSGSPHIYSIIVLQPYVQGAGGYGHVAVVVGFNKDGSVLTSNWNWYAGGGGWARTSYWNFFPGPGVTFVWYPGT
ncbi:MAG TPA: CHAP domain-containing protein [Ktedonobacteraceae bacterium]|nr:CHAP domain-containing protein [Ktedonobacteraceae bacterium]